MKQTMLVVATTKNQKDRMYNFIAESVSPIATRYEEDMIETDKFKVLFRYDGDESVVTLDLCNYVYLGTNTMYEMLYLQPTLAKNKAKI